MVGLRSLHSLVPTYDFAVLLEAATVTICTAAELSYNASTSPPLDDAVVRGRPRADGVCQAGQSAAPAFLRIVVIYCYITVKYFKVSPLTQPPCAYVYTPVDSGGRPVISGKALECVGPVVARLVFPKLRLLLDHTCALAGEFLVSCPAAAVVRRYRLPAGWQEIDCTIVTARGKALADFACFHFPSFVDVLDQEKSQFKPMPRNLPGPVVFCRRSPVFRQNAPNRPDSLRVFGLRNVLLYRGMLLCISRPSRLESAANGASRNGSCGMRGGRQDVIFVRPMPLV
jgi:hypothetical protein